jgi:hypothetical protein
MRVTEAFNVAEHMDPHERQWRYRTVCRPRGFCRHQLLDGPCRLTWCPDCLTLYDDERVINQRSAW